MRARGLVFMLLAALVLAGCAGSELKARKDAAWAHVPQALPDTHDPNPGGYGHILRPIAFLLHPVGVAFDYALARPFYMLGGLAPEWFGLTAEDGQRYQQHFPELTIPRDAPRRFAD